MFKKLLALALLALFLTSCAPPKPADFSAEVVVKAQGLTQKSKFYYSNDKWRYESNAMGQKSIVIYRKDKNLTWILMPTQKMYMEQKLQNEQMIGVTSQVPGEVKKEKLGKETINGIECIKYKITYENKNAKVKNSVYQWTSKNNIVIKSQAADGSWVMEYKNIKYGKSPASLFELPSDYKKFKMPY